jgi:hypothetical protein
MPFMKPAKLFLFFSIFGFLACPAQEDSIFLMNGRVVAKKVIDTTFETVTIANPSKAGKSIHFESSQLYMVKFSQGNRRYYYSQDSLAGNILSRGEMWMYMKGENDARKGYKARGALIGGGIAGLLGGMTGTIWGPILPYGFMVCTGIPRIRIRAKTVSRPEYIESNGYLMGYERVARQRQKLYSLASGTAGLIAGYAIYALLHQYYPEKVDVGFGGR